MNEHLRGTDRSKTEPYKPYVFPRRPSLQNSSPLPVSFLKLLVTALHKIPPSTNTLYRGVAKSLAQLPQKFEKRKSVVWWAGLGLTLGIKNTGKFEIIVTYIIYVDEMYVSQ